MSELSRVMCVEDDPDIRHLLHFSLANVGKFDVRCCDSATAALDELTRFEPQMILLDVMMPVMSGPEFLKLLKQRTWPSGAMPIVLFVTAKAMPRELESLLELGAAGVVVKPFEPVQLPGHLRMYWSHLGPTARPSHA